MSLTEFFKSFFIDNIIIGKYNLSFNLLELIINFLLPTIILIILYKIIIRSIGKRVCSSSLTKEKRNSLLKWIRTILKIIVFAVALLLIINFFGAEISTYFSIFRDTLTHPIVEGISIMTILLIIPILYIARTGGRIAEKFARSSIIPYIKIGSNTIIVAGIARNVAIVIILLFGLTLIGFNLSLLYGLFGLIGIGIGFGLQGLVGNLFAGIVILTTKPVKIGDHIVVDGTEGDLVDIRFVSSVVSTISHESIIIPNSKIIDNPVYNYSFDDKSIIIINSIQVSYETDIDMALSFLIDVIDKCPYKVFDKEGKSRLKSFDDSGITLETICWIEDSFTKNDAKAWINLEIWRKFKNENVEIPFPQLDLKIKK